MPVVVAESDVVSRFVEDVDSNKSAPPGVIPAAFGPNNYRDKQTFALSVAQRSTSRPEESVSAVTDI